MEGLEKEVGGACPCLRIMEPLGHTKDLSIGGETHDWTLEEYHDWAL